MKVPKYNLFNLIVRSLLKFSYLIDGFRNVVGKYIINFKISFSKIIFTLRYRLINDKINHIGLNKK